MPRVFVLGLDCLSPQLLFGPMWPHLEHLPRLARFKSTLRSCMPPITVPAWACMTTGRPPEALGLYGFRGRADRSYDARQVPSAQSFVSPPLWSWLNRAGLRSCVIGVPLTYPARPMGGRLVTGPLTPHDAPVFTYPQYLSADIRARCPGYAFDVSDFRMLDPEALLGSLIRMTEQRFALATEWVRSEAWSFFMLVEIALDRAHHVFWPSTSDDGALDAHHPLVRYYRALDACVGRLLDALRDDDVVMTVSDHGAQSCSGFFALNQWLLDRGDLVLTEPPDRVRKLEPEHVDWTKTKAWADGGYVGRIHLNIEGREPQGVLARAETVAYIDALRADLAALDLPGIGTNAVDALPATELYPNARGIAPDLTICLGGLAVRAVGTVGHQTHFPKVLEHGSDLANHHPDGVLMMRCERPLDVEGYTPTLFDIAPTVLSLLDVTLPSELEGRSLVSVRY